MNNLATLPPPLQRAIVARDLALTAFDPTIDSLDISWEIVEGNLSELVATLDVFDTDDQAKASALWRQPSPAKHRYHREIVRRFHNALSAAVAHLDHTKRAAALLKRYAPDSHEAYCQRQNLLDENLEFLVAIRDFSIHAGAHQSVLTLRGTAEGGMVGRVGLAVEPILVEQRAKLKAARSQREKRAATVAIARLEAAGGTVEIRPLLRDYYDQVNAYRVWFRQEMIGLHERLSNDLASWASPGDRAVVVQYFVDNPIPVIRAGK